MKVTTDSCLFGAWCANEILNETKHKDGSARRKMLDIGTGTGLLSLMVAQKNDLDITAIEIEKNAADQARENVHDSPFADSINVLEADVLQYSDSGFDYIVCNPPFYENELQSPEAKRNIAHHSHLLRWEQLFPAISSKLKSGGSAFLLLPSSRKELATNLVLLAGLHINKEIFVMQSDGRSPFRRMIKISGSKTEPVVNDLFIRDETGNYSELFRSYLRDYYLDVDKG